ncbi:MAG: type II toxin-antitoxin system VapC family toxin [Hyphomicrobiales bacterium]|nr:type II toxin-antitoxin system VapC family toxin [Hyphomicrobiales bacterium]
MSLLLDTCAAIWITEDASLSNSAVEALKRAGHEGTSIHVSPITAWEIGLLVSRGRVALPVGPEAWFNRLLEAPNVRLSQLPPQVLVASSFLPGEPPRDPADRILAATARAYDLVLITRDNLLLAYSHAGHLKAIQC